MVHYQVDLGYFINQEYVNLGFLVLGLCHFYNKIKYFIFENNSAINFHHKINVIVYLF